MKFLIISIKISQNSYKIISKFPQNLHTISVKYSLNFPTILSPFLINFVKISLNFVKFLNISVKFARSCYITFLRFSENFLKNFRSTSSKLLQDLLNISTNYPQKFCDISMNLSLFVQTSIST